MRLSIAYIVLILTACFISACTSPQAYAEKRRQRLLEIYPPEKTTHDDVVRKWSPTKPEFSYTRPAAGWVSFTNSYIGNNVNAVEMKTGKQVNRVERYLGVDGLSTSLARCWFYYDSEERLIDAAWQYTSD